MTSWSLQARILAALALVGVLVVGGSLGAGFTLAALRSAQDEVVSDYYRALTASSAQLADLIEAESSLHGHALTGDPAELDRARTLLEQDPEQARLRLRTLLAEDPASRRALDRWEGSAATWRSRWALPAVSRAEAGTPLDAAQVREGVRLFADVRRDYTSYASVAREGRAQAVAHVERLSALLFTLVLALGAVALLAVTALFVLLRRWVTRPIAHLAEQTRMVRDGALDHEVSTSGSAELAALGADVDAMRRRLGQEVAHARQAEQEAAAANTLLAEQAEDLQRSNRELEQFAYVASHDLQEPLRKVASFTQLLQRRYGGQLDERADQYIEYASDGARRMQQLINDLLGFSRVGRMGGEQEAVALEDCLRTALGDLSGPIEETGAVVTHDPLPTVAGERSLLTQLFANLVGNAVKFRSAEAPRIHLTAHREGDHWALSCTDNGIGIEPQYAERVFVIFQRLHPKDRYVGTGIGLALCKKIVEHHGGRIWVDTVDAAGTRAGTIVRWTLPAAPAELTAAPTALTGAPTANDGDDHA